MHRGPILLGVDESDRRHDAAALAATLARALDAPVLVAHVYAVDQFPLVGVAALGALGPPAAAPALPGPPAAAQALVDEVATALGDDLAYETEVVASGSPARGLYELAERRDCRLIVIGTARRGPVGRLLLGSVGTRLTQGSPCAIAVAPPGYATAPTAPLPRRIGVGYDGSPEADVALDFAAELAQRTGAQLVLWLVVAPAGAPEEPDWADYRRWLDDWARHQLDHGLTRLPQGITARGEVLEGGDAAERLAERGADVDLLVTGSRGYGPARRVFLGATSAALLHRAPCPVIVLPRGADAA